MNKMRCPVCEELDKIDTDIECYLCHGVGEIGEEKLDACPLCGYAECWFKADIVIDEDRNTVVGFIGIYCPGCETNFSFSHCHPHDVAQAWNRRPTESTLRKRVGELCKLVKSAYIAGYQEGSQDYFGDQPEARYRAESIWLSSKWRKALTPQDPTPPETEASDE